MGGKPNTDAHLWNRFCGLYAGAPREKSNSQIVKDFTLSCLNVMHPTEARPAPLLRFFKRFLGYDKSPEDLESLVDDLALTQKRLKRIVKSLTGVLRSKTNWMTLTGCNSKLHDCASNPWS